MKHPFPASLLLAALAACAPTAKTSAPGAASAPAATPSAASATPPAAPATDWRAEADAFLKTYSAEYVRRYTASSEAEWRSNTRIVAGDSANAVATRRANEAMAAFQGSALTISRLKELLAHQDRLTPLQIKQLQVALYNAASSPQTVADVVKRRIKAETQQTEALYGYEYKLNGKAVTTNDLDELLRKETDPAKRLAAWEASKAVGPGLRAGLLNLRGPAQRCGARPRLPRLLHLPGVGLRDDA